MLAWLPNLHDLRSLGGLIVALLLCLLLGAASTSRRTPPEIQVVAGWGLACLVLTVWGVLTPWSLRLPAGALGLVAVASLLRPGWRARLAPCLTARRLLLLTLPLWLIMLPARPSQIDTWLNLLPNAGYLFDYDMLPTAQRPPSHSFLPVAPYNSQFADYLASLAAGALGDNTMGLFNIALLCAAALLLARVVAGSGGAPPWWACAVGLLLAVPLNPGFVPRVFFAPYGEASLAVTTMFAVWLATDLLVDLAHGIRWPKATTALALVLAALINIKQSGIGLLLPIGIMILVLAVADRRIPRRHAIATIATALTPAVMLYLLWRGFAVTSFVAGELEVLPVSAWNVGLLPQILWSMLVVMFQKITFFLCVGGVLAAAVVVRRRDPWSREGVLVSMIAGVILLFNGFLIFTYVAHFPPDWAARAHSYFRYASQISLLVMLGLASALRPVAVRWVTEAGWLARHGASASVAAILVLPLATAPLLRFDLDTPQPAVWELGHQAARYVAPGGRLALLLPGDTDDSVGSMLRGVVLYTEPRRPGVDFRVETRADAATLRSVAESGYRTALVSCTPAGLAGVPANVAAMLRLTDDGWEVLQTWQYPPELMRHRFAALLARGPLCAASVP